MITYHEAKEKPETFRALTGIDPSEFEELLRYFEVTYSRDIEEKITNSGNRQRNPGGGRKAGLLTMEDKLFFIWFYFKNYPLQEVIACLFGLSQSQANEWIHRLTAVLKATLQSGDYLPKRCPEQLREVLSNSSTQELAIDGTERRIQRPSDHEKQKYSGKKKAHTVKNDIVVDVTSRHLEYLSQTVEGKQHDKKILDEQEISFPPNSSIYKDSGFQGYEPKGTLTYQPQKKPRGRELHVGETILNSIISSTRVVVEHVISGIKRGHIVKDVFRNTKQQFNDIVMEIAGGLHNFRTQYRKAQNDEKLMPIFL